MIFSTRGKTAAGFLAEDQARAGEQDIAVDGAQDLFQVVVVNVLAGEGDGLVEQALGVAHAALGGLGDQVRPEGEMVRLSALAMCRR